MKQKICYYGSLALVIILVCSFYFTFFEFKKNKTTIYNLEKKIDNLSTNIINKEKNIATNTLEIEKLKKEKEKAIKGYYNWQRWLKELKNLS